MSSRKTKRSQKLGSSRRNKNRNRETEEIDNDDGFQDPGNEEHESEQSQFLTVSEKQSSNESSLLHPDQPVIACTNPSTSVLEFSPQPQSQDFKDLLGQADITSKKRKMGSTRKGNRNFKYEGIYEDEAEYKVQLSEGVSNELEVPVEASIKEDGGKEDQTSLVDCAPSQSSENESSVLQGKHLSFDTILQNEDDSKNDEHQHFEETLQSKPMDISSSELNQSKEAELSQNLIDDQSSSTFVIKDILEGSHAEDIGQDELTGVQSASLINEHEHVTEVDKVATVIWENVNSKASTEDENTVALCLEHTDETLQLTQETIYKSESTEVREDTGKYKEVSDLYFISEPESPPISHPVSEASIMKTSPSVVSTGGKQKIDFEQWNEQIPDFGQTLYNIVMVGNSNVGKTSFIKRLQSGQFIQDYSATIGVDTFVHTVTFGSRTVKLYVWDTAGQERYHSITRQVFHKAQGLLLMYDITSSQSFHAVRAWISQIKENAPTDVIMMLLGNKNDCADREVQLQQGEDLSKEYDIHFMECSVATGENVSESLKTLAWLLLKQRVRKEEEYTTLQPKPQSKKSGCC